MELAVGMAIGLGLFAWCAWQWSEDLGEQRRTNLRKVQKQMHRPITQQEIKSVPLCDPLKTGFQWLLMFALALAAACGMFVGM